MSRTLIAMLFAGLCLLAPAAFAHVQNERSLYEDIQFSDATREIVFLRGISAISAPETGAQLFRPKDLLSRADLAYWASVFHATPEQRSNADAEAMRQQSLAEALVPSLDGNATYGDINQAYFDGGLSLADPDATPTREQFAVFLGDNFDSLAKRVGAHSGPVGPVESVAERVVKHGDAESTVSVLMIGGIEYVVAHHPKVLFAPPDLSLWQGRGVDESWLMDEGGEQVLMIVAFPQGTFSEAQVAGGGHGHGDGAGGHGDTAGAPGHHDDPAAVEEPPHPLGSYLFPAVVIALLLVIGAWLFWRRRNPV